MDVAVWLRGLVGHVANCPATLCENLTLDPPLFMIARGDRQ